MAARKTSKSWFVKLKAPDGTEGEVKVKGVTTPEDAIGKVEVPDGYAIISARPVRKFSVKAEAPTTETPGDTDTSGSGDASDGGAVDAST